MALLPLHPPEAVQLVALVEFHARVALPPLVTPVGLAVSVIVGNTGDGCGLDDPPSDAEPPEPPQPHDNVVARRTAIRVRICSASSLR